MKKRLVCAALASVMAFSLAACGGNAAETEAETKAPETAETEAAEAG